MQLKFISLWVLIICNMNIASAQKNVSGEYYLEGVMETASGFKLNKDSTFDFFFSYGALDRQGLGKWMIRSDSIVLNSKPYPGKDFKLVKQTASNSKFPVLKLEDANSNLYQFVYCLLHSSAKDTLLRFDADGLVELPYAADSVILSSELSAERISSFVLSAQAAEYTFNFEPWIFEVFFKDYKLHFAGNYLEGKHPLLDDKTYRFNKQE